MNVFHFKYLNWFDIPPTTTGFVKFYNAAMEAQPPNTGPILVHCRYHLLLYLEDNFIFYQTLKAI